MKIEQGKIYLTKSGERIGPVVWDKEINVWRRDENFVRNIGDYWHEDGSRYGHCEDELDLAEEAKE